MLATVHGKVLEDGRTLSDYNIHNEDILKLQALSVPEASAASAAAASQQPELWRTQDDSAVFCVEKGSRWHVPNPEAFLALSFQWEQVKHVETAVMEAVPRIATLWKVAGHTSVFCVEKGSRWHVPNPAAFLALGFQWVQVKTVETAVMEAVPLITTLWQVAGHASVFCVEKGSRWHVPNPAAFLALGFQWVQVKTVETAVMEAVPLITTLWQVAGHASVFCVEKGSRWHVPNPAAFLALGFQWAQVKTVETAVMETVPRIATLWKTAESSAVWKVEHGSRWWVVNPEMFLALGFHWEQVKKVGAAVLEAVPEGATPESAFRVNIGSPDNQLFRFTPSGDGPWGSFVAKHSGCALEVLGGSADNHAPLVQHSPRQGEASQLFAMEPAADASGWSIVRCKHSGKVLDVSGNSSNDFVKVIQYDMHGRANQLFRHQIVTEDG